jgi:hypothetical protein
MLELKMKNVVRVFALASLFTVNAFADQTTTLVKCIDLKKGHREYGCDAVEDSEIRNDKFQCLQAMKSFDFLQNEITEARRRSTRRHKPTIIPGKKAIVMGMAHGQLNISDSDKDYKVSKEKMAEAIKEKIGHNLDGKKYVSLVVKTPKGEAKVKVELKESNNGSDFSVESWEQDNSPEKADDIMMALGQNDMNTDMGSENLANKATDNINNAQEAIAQQKHDVEQEFDKKIQEIDSNSNLATLEKISFKRALRGQKDRKLSELQALMDKVPHYKAQVKESCGGQNKIVKAGSISGESSESSLEGSTNVASR